MWCKPLPDAMADLEAKINLPGELTGLEARINASVEGAGYLIGKNQIVANWFIVGKKPYFPEEKSCCHKKQQ